MEKLTQKWCIAAFFDELDEGYEFHRTEVPLHITLAGVFAIGDKSEEIYAKLSDLLIDQDSFTVTAGEDVLWGENNDLRVVLIEKSKEMSLLLMKIYEHLLFNGAIFKEPQYEGQGHISHSTVQKTGRLNKGDKVLINKVSLVDMFPNNDGMRRRIAGTVKF
jgi:2'-5' RNA ligase